jgi:hypothetical protein
MWRCRAIFCCAEEQQGKTSIESSLNEAEVAWITQLQEISELGGFGSFRDETFLLFLEANWEQKDEKAFFTSSINN